MSNVSHTPEEILEKVVKITAEQLGVEAKDISKESNFANDLGADSLDTVELVMALEDEFNIEIPDEDAEKITTIQQAVDHLSLAKSQGSLSEPAKNDKS